MAAYLVPFCLLVISNIFMTFAWYGHLKFEKSPLLLAIIASWGIALFEYVFQVPANRYGHLAGLSVGKLKIMQEVITLAVFIVFAKTYLGEKITWNYYVGFACVLVGVVFIYLDKL